MKWEVKKLGEVCSLINGRAYKKTELLETGKYLVLRVGNFFSNRSWYYSDLELDKDKYCDNGDLLYAWSASFGARIWDGEKVIYHYHIWKIKLDEKRIDKKFLFHWFEWDKELIKKEQGAGTTMIHVTKTAMEKRNLAIPPLEEQKRIVKILDESFEAIALVEANTKRNLANARELFQSYLDKSIHQNNSNWLRKSLKDILSQQPRNGWSPPAKNHSDTGIPVLTLSSVTGFNFNSEKVKFTNAPVKEDAHYWLKNGDFLMTRSNTPELVGHVAICKNIIEPTIYCDLIMKMSIDTEWADTKFIYWYFRTSKLRKLISNSAQGANPTMKKINKSIVQSFPVLIPPVAEQKSILSKVKQCYEETQKLEGIYQRKLEALAELKQSILQKAFTGQLTT